ncbi:hypothetical protein ACFOG5_07445 [Pedobacter fastidiosus]|uniref:Lipoprotein n=1 Tax=Pedobacter fastidiosus TaxID=2765361 RepID=A0ABR7KPJ5_9SPHI|nr:hypothetical protein [Pedobacter fastidiosus]MBC6110009.1 hypothetical protein [Pedobacter fastidiosus]
MKKISILALFVAVISGCGSMRSASSSSVITLSGSIQKMNMSTYQYGTHTISANGKPYALKSSSVILDTYLDKQVTITGIKVAGYPLEGGPELIEVSEVILK